MKAYERFLGYAYEGFLFFLALVFIAMFQNGFPPIAAFLLVFLFVPVVLLYFYHNKRSLSYVWLFLLMISCAVLGWILGFSLVLAVMLSAACCWRAAVHFFVYSRTEDRVNGYMLLIAALFFTLILTVCIPNYAFHRFVFLIAVLQMVFLLGLKTIDRGTELTATQRSIRPAFLKWASGGLVALLLGCAVVSLIYSLIRHFVFAVIGLLLKGVLSVLAYPIYLILSQFNFKLKYLDRFGKANASNGNKIKHLPLPDSSSSHFPLWLIFAALAVAGLIIAWIIIRKASPLSVPENEKDELVEGPDYYNEMISSRKRKRVRPPSDEIRRLFYLMQGTLNACGFGRLPSEPVRDWFDRIELDPKQKSTIAAGYRKVRYGEESLTASEKNQYETAVRELIREARQNKRRKE